MVLTSAPAMDIAPPMPLEDDPQVQDQKGHADKQ
jgi:hypothetical protein